MAMTGMAWPRPEPWSVVTCTAASISGSFGDAAPAGVHGARATVAVSATSNDSRRPRVAISAPPYRERRQARAEGCALSLGAFDSYLTLVAARSPPSVPAGVS